MKAWKLVQTLADIVMWVGFSVLFGFPGQNSCPSPLAVNKHCGYSFSLPARSKEITSVLRE